MHKQHGFTLIELIIVIVILGILAVTAAPRFIDIQSDATKATLEGASAALKGAANLVFAKSAIEGETQNAESGTTASQLVLNGIIVETHFGYPAPLASITSANINAWAELDAEQWTLTSSSSSIVEGGTVHITLAGTDPVSRTAAANTQCQIVYIQPAGLNQKPTITVQSEGC